MVDNRRESVPAYSSKELEMSIWDTIYTTGKKILSEAVDQTSEVTQAHKRLKGKSDKELLDIANKSAWKHEGKDQMVARSMLRKRGYTDEQIKR
jgi:hypothetical protein